MSKEKECPICHKVGFHKMSCPKQKVTVFISDENPEQKDISKMETTESGVSEIPTYQADRKIGNTDFVICSRVNRLDNNRCVNCGAKSGHPCQMKPNESNYC